MEEEVEEGEFNEKKRERNEEESCVWSLLLLLLLLDQAIASTRPSVRKNKAAEEESMSFLFQAPCFVSLIAGMRGMR